MNDCFDLNSIGMTVNNSGKIYFPSEIISHISGCLRAVEKIEEDILVLDGEDPYFCWVLSLAALCSGKIVVPVNPRLNQKEKKLLLSNLHGSWVLIDSFQLSSDSRPLPVVQDLSKPALIIFTSGSSGNPKGVVHSWKNLLTAGRSSKEFYALDHQSSWLQSLGMFHIGGFMTAVRMLLAGGQWVIPGDKKIGDWISREPVDYLSLVPTQLHDLLHSDKAEELAKSKGVLLGGAATPLHLLEQVLEKGIPISLCYGSSETSAQIFATEILHTLPQKGLLGRLMPYRQLKISGDDTEVVDEGICLGYLSDGEFQCLNSILLPDKIDKGQDELYYFKGRKDLIFKCGGENISPSAMESVLVDRLQSEHFFRIIPVADQRLGQVPVLVIRPGSNGILDLEQIHQCLSEQFSSLWRPRAIYKDLREIEGKESLKSIQDAIEKDQLELLWP